MVDMRRLPSRWMCSSTRERGWQFKYYWFYGDAPNILKVTMKYIILRAQFPILVFNLLHSLKQVWFDDSPLPPSSFLVPEIWVQGSLACSAAVAMISCNILILDASRIYTILKVGLKKIITRVKQNSNWVGRELNLPPIFMSCRDGANHVVTSKIFTCSQSLGTGNLLAAETWL